MSFEENLRKIKARHNKLNDQLASGNFEPEEYAEITKEFADLNELVDKINEYENLLNEIEEYKNIVSEGSEDKDLVEFAEEELSKCRKKLPEIEHNLKLALLPKDEADDKNAILEIRAGAGGEEASLFAADLFKMYARYAESKGWKFEVMGIQDSDAGGYKEASATISGEGVFYRLKHESGVHRVQRVPDTETGGRVHTSTATVAILPEAEDFDITINDKDLRIDSFRSSGAGGQHVNTTDSAIRITHYPSGVVVQQQEEKSQHKNKAKALKILRAKLYEMERERRAAERDENRKGQVGKGDRSERIRTYNFPQGRVSDHRINLTLYKIDEIVKQGNLEEIINGLISKEEMDKLSDNES
jgi:peptide chain release factor 1